MNKVFMRKVPDCVRMIITPKWSEKIDERGMPVDPVNANRSRNRVRNLFAHGTITSITLRLRYASIFCWGLDQLSEDREDRYNRLKNIEKMFCLASRYQQLQREQDGEVLRGMDGNSEFDYEYSEFEEVNLEELELLKNDGYAYGQFYQNQLQNFLLKRGEFELTEAGKELADIVAGELESKGERILNCARQGTAERADFEAISREFANQSLYLHPEFSDERQALQKVLLGFLNWVGNKRTGSVTLAGKFPTEVRLDVLDHLHSTIDSGELEEAGASKLYQRYFRGYHHYRAAHSCFLIRSWELQSDTNDDLIHLTTADKQQFHQYRELMRLYWLQSYLGFAIEAQLEALCTFLNSRIPPRTNYDKLLERLAENDRIRTEFARVTQGLMTTQGTEPTASSDITRDLMLYGIAEPVDPEVSVSTIDPDPEITVREAIDTVKSEISDGWESNPAISKASDLNEVFLGKLVRNSLNKMRENIDNKDAQLEYWTTSLARSIALLFLVVARFNRLKQRRKWLYNYGYNRFDSPYTSISELMRFVQKTPDNTPLHEFARGLIHNKVVQTHLQVFYSRLSPGNLKRAISFDQDERLCLEVDEERGSRPFVASVGLIRYDEMNTLLRDAGLLSETQDGYKPTEAGLDILSRVSGVTDE